MWDVLTNKEAVEVVATAPSRSSSARTLVEAAVRAWRMRYPSSKMDDCAAVCLFLDSESYSYTASAMESSLNVKDEGVDWSALEGVSRVNTLLTLPRFPL